MDKRPHKNKKDRNIILDISTFVAILILLFLSSAHLGLNPGEFISGIPNIAGFIVNMFPPDFSVIPDLLLDTLTTLETAFWGTFIGVIISLIMSVFAARNLLGKNPLIGGLTRFIFTLFRSLPDMVWALIFVSAVGLGAFAGVLALIVYSIGELGKIFAEAIENIDEGPREALESTGANQFKVTMYAVVPQISPEIITFSLFRFESNVRRAFILGMVGAGGLGFQLNVSMRLFRYHEVSAIIILIITIVILTDSISGYLRSKII
ncbi:MAG: phosphonate ABC transporter, permease protein PhnE [Peptoniphilus sp.]|nr:phosphonate ABC transporter, permease protein PhnE [Peptoniphilus sp.]